MAQTAETSGVRARLKAHKEKNGGARTVTLKESGVVCDIPKFINHGAWMRAQRIGGSDVPKAQAAFICEAVLFDGEKLTVTDLAELVPSGDALQLIGEVFGKGEDDEGKEQPAVQ